MMNIYLGKLGHLKYGQAIVWQTRTFCQLNPKEQTSVKFIIKNPHSRKYIWKCSLHNIGQFVSASIVLCKPGNCLDASALMNVFRHNEITLTTHAVKNEFV